MADTQIDELRLDITVEDKTSGESSDKKVKNLATAISRLNKNLQAFDNAKFTKVFENMSKGLDPFVKKIESVSSALASLATIVSKGGLDKAVKEVTGKVPELKTETTSDSGRQSEPIQAVQGQAEELNNVKKQLNGINKELDKTAKKSDKAKKPLGQLLKSFGRIAMYRAVRRTIQEITQAFMESIDGIAKYNSEFRDTMGSLQSSMAKAKASMGVAFYQVLILLEPLITQIANGIANLANSLAKVTANMRGVAKYTKINTEYMKEYQSATQGTLLAFDTFTTLSAGQGTDYSKMFETGEDALDESQFTSTEKTLLNIVNTIKEIWKLVIDLVDAIKPILDPIINDLLPAVTELLSPIVEIVAIIVKILTPAINAIIKVVDNIIKQMSGAFKIISGLLKVLTGDFQGAWDSIKNGFANMANSIIKILNVLLLPINKLGRLFGASESFAQIPLIPTQAFAQGGMMTNASFAGAGTMYALAGESGAEVVATGSAGTGVLNVDQFADAMVSALVRYGAARDTSNGTTIVLDGNKVGQLVASNVGFRNEANRRNAGLNWK